MSSTEPALCSAKMNSAPHFFQPGTAAGGEGARAQGVSGWPSSAWPSSSFVDIKWKVGFRLGAGLGPGDSRLASLASRSKVVALHIGSRRSGVHAAQCNTYVSRILLQNLARRLHRGNNHRGISLVPHTLKPSDRKAPN